MANIFPTVQHVNDWNRRAASITMQAQGGGGYGYATGGGSSDMTDVTQRALAEVMRKRIEREATAEGCERALQMTADHMVAEDTLVQAQTDLAAYGSAVIFVSADGVSHVPLVEFVTSARDAYYDQVKADARERRRNRSDVYLVEWGVGCEFPSRGGSLDRAMSIPSHAERSFGSMLTPARRHGQD